MLVDQTSGMLAVKDVKIPKVPVPEDGVWIPRYTFDNETFAVIN